MFNFLASTSLTQLHIVIALAIFLIVYALIISELIDRTAVALVGAALMITFQILGQDKAFEHIDFNTIGLLLGMMIIMNILKRTGVFQYMAIKAAKIAKGDPWKIILFFSIITGVASAFLNNVTTLLLIAPVTFVITDTLKISPIPFIIPEVFASNIMGTATLVGDPPNMMVGSTANIGFMDFIVNLSPVIIVIFIITMLLFKIIYRKQLIVAKEDKEKILSFNEKITITDKGLLIKSLTILFLTIIGFVISDTLKRHFGIDLQTATIALLGASLLIIITKSNVEEILLEVEWPALFFFIGLFIIVGGLVETGLIDDLAHGIVSVTHGNLLITTMLILWVSAIASSILDNIPYVATMIPLIHNLEAHGMNAHPLWWALVLGACLGGNGTLIGASPNVIAASMLNKNGHKFGFTDFLKIGFPLMIVSIAISSVYLYFVYINDFFKVLIQNIIH